MPIRPMTIEDGRAVFADEVSDPETMMLIPLTNGTKDDPSFQCRIVALVKRVLADRLPSHGSGTEKRGEPAFVPSPTMQRAPKVQS